MGVTHALDILDQFDGKLPVTEDFAFRTAHPGFEMHFVDGNRLFEPAALAPRQHPLIVLPPVSVDIADHGCGFWRRLRLKSVRIRLHLLITLDAGPHLVFVRIAVFYAGDEDFPDAGIAAPHYMATRIPLVEIADDGDNFGIGRPDGEANSIHPLERGEVRAERPP